MNLRFTNLITADQNANMGLSHDGRASSDPKADYGQPGSAVHPEYEAKPIDDDAVTPNTKPFELREALMKKPSNMDKAKKLANPYPTVESAMVRAGHEGIERLESEVETLVRELGDQEPQAVMFLKQALAALTNANHEMGIKANDMADYPSVDAAIESESYPVTEKALEGGIVEDNDHLEKLGIENAEEFGVKYKGQLDILAEEHDLGDLIAYALTDYGIIIWGTDNVLKTDYSFENPDIKPAYYFE